MDISSNKCYFLINKYCDFVDFFFNFFFFFFTSTMTDLEIESFCAKYNLVHSKNLLSEDAIAYYKESFRIFDPSGTGWITVDELNNILLRRHSSLSIDKIEEMIEYADKNNDGKINFEEFVLLMVRSQTSEMEEAFKMFDTENKGYIDKSNLKRLLLRTSVGNVSDNDIQMMIDRADSDCDGVISFADFQKMFKQ